MSTISKVRMSGCKHNDINNIIYEWILSDRSNPMIKDKLILKRQNNYKFQCTYRAPKYVMKQKLTELVRNNNYSTQQLRHSYLQ